MENKVRAIKRPVYFTISLIAFPFCLPCLPPVGTVQNTYTPMAHVCFRLYVLLYVSDARLYVSIAFDPCKCTHTHTHTCTAFYLTRNVYRGKKSRNYRWKALQRCVLRMFIELSEV